MDDEFYGVRKNCPLLTLLSWQLEFWGIGIKVLEEHACVLLIRCLINDNILLITY